MDAREFLDERRATWSRLPDDVITEYSEEERTLVRSMEEKAIEGQFHELSQLFLGCNNRFQFAKTYRVWRAGLQKTLSELEAGDPNLPPAFSRAAKQIAENNGRQWLEAMEWWFLMRFADASDRRQAFQQTGGAPKPGQPYDDSSPAKKAIEIYAGKPGSGGCLVFLVALLSAGLAAAWWLMG